MGIFGDVTILLVKKTQQEVATSRKYNRLKTNRRCLSTVREAVWQFIWKRAIQPSRKTTELKLFILPKAAAYAYTKTPEGFSYGVRRNSLPSNANQHVRGESQLLVCLIKQGEPREDVYRQPVSFLHGSWQDKALQRSPQPVRCALQQISLWDSILPES